MVPHRRVQGDFPSLAQMDTERQLRWCASMRYGGTLGLCQLLKDSRDAVMVSYPNGAQQHRNRLGEPVDRRRSAMVSHW